MAIDPRNSYPGQVALSDPAYPFGKARNVIEPGDGYGTPFTADLVNDGWGFFQALLVAGGLEPSGIPETAFNSQYMAAMQAWISGRAWQFTNQIVHDHGPISDPSWGEEYRTFEKLVPLSAYIGLGPRYGIAIPNSHRNHEWHCDDSYDGVVACRSSIPNGGQTLQIDLTSLVPTGAVLSYVRVRSQAGASEADPDRRMAFALNVNTLNRQTGARTREQMAYHVHAATGTTEVLATISDISNRPEVSRRSGAHSSEVEFHRYILECAPSYNATGSTPDRVQSVWVGVSEQYANRTW